jgi:asparagine synthetase B (glutamine-hydrolysing)
VLRSGGVDRTTLIRILISTAKAKNIDLKVWFDGFGPDSKSYELSAKANGTELTSYIICHYIIQRSSKVLRM